MRNFALAATLGLLTLSPALSQETTFTTTDSELMVACTSAALERMRTDASDAQPAAGTGTDPMRLADCIGAASGPCMETDQGMSTVGMSECLAQETDWWDSQLNVDYAALREELDEESAEALQAAQRAWIDWRDTKCEFEYTYWREGTIGSTYYGSCMLDLTAERAIDFKTYVEWGAL